MATKDEVQKFIQAHYKRAKGLEVFYVDSRGINIIDKGGIGVPYKWIAKRLIEKYRVWMILFFAGSKEGNVWGFTRETLKRSNLYA